MGGEGYLVRRTVQRRSAWRDEIMRMGGVEIVMMGVGEESVL